jgi:putrescine aminotransferase
MQEKTNASLYEAYGQYINAAYPQYLERLGLNKPGARAEGATITDTEGKTYIDCSGGYGLFNLGHNHPRIIKAITDQLQIGQPFNKPFIAEQQVRLADKLSGISPEGLTCSFLCNSGSEAVDSALKLARLTQGKPGIIATQGGFHGYTYGALSVTGIDSFTRSFHPLVPGITHVPFGDSKSLSDRVNADTAAFVVEIVQHESGVNLASEAYFKEVREICDRNGVLLIVDEIKTGFGKTGRMFACEHYGLVPDIMVLGKSMGGGLIPVGALLGRENLWRKFSYSFPMSASSFAGNILACAAAIEVIEILRSGELIESGAEKGERLRAGLSQLIEDYPELLKRASGMGLLVGLQASDDAVAFALSREAIARGVLVFQAFSNRSVLMLEPPLVITGDQIERIISAVEGACEKLSEER